MTITSEQTTSPARTNTLSSSPSDKLTGLLNAYRQNFLRNDRKVEMLQDTTLSFQTDKQRKGGNQASRSSSFAAERHAEVLRSLLNRVRAQQARSSDTPSTRVAGMEKWEGRVLEVDDAYFTVELVPFADGAEVIADFSTELLSDDDEVQPGDVVYVTVRTVTGTGGPTRTSAVRLRRLGTWTETEVSAQKERAKERLSKLAPYFD